MLKKYSNGLDKCFGNFKSSIKMHWVWGDFRIAMREKPHTRGKGPILTIPSPHPKLPRHFLFETSKMKYGIIRIVLKIQLGQNTSVRRQKT